MFPKEGACIVVGPGVRERAHVTLILCFNNHRGVSVARLMCCGAVQTEMDNYACLDGCGGQWKQSGEILRL